MEKAGWPDMVKEGVGRTQGTETQGCEILSQDGLLDWWPVVMDAFNVSEPEVA